jgi:hypothetical protein
MAWKIKYFLTPNGAELRILNDFQTFLDCLSDSDPLKIRAKLSDLTAALEDERLSLAGFVCKYCGEQVGDHGYSEEICWSCGTCKDCGDWVGSDAQLYDRCSDCQLNTDIEELEAAERL